MLEIRELSVHFFLAPACATKHRVNDNRSADEVE
jgi:hypothetical protein